MLSVCTFYSSIWEAETGGGGKFEASLSYKASWGDGGGSVEAKDSGFQALKMKALLRWALMRTQLSPGKPW